MSQRRNSGGARREASERLLMRRGDSELTAWTLNLSRGGLRVVVEEPVELGVEYELLFSGDDAEKTRRARVVWVRDEHDGQIAGLEFTSIRPGKPSPETS